LKQARKRRRGLVSSLVTVCVTAATITSCGSTSNRPLLHITYMAAAIRTVQRSKANNATWCHHRRHNNHRNFKIYRYMWLLTQTQSFVLALMPSAILRSLPQRSTPLTHNMVYIITVVWNRRSVAALSSRQRPRLPDRLY
jgi:hypothetical protein